MNPPNPDGPPDHVLDDSAQEDEADESLGFFPSWGSLYATVIVYTIGLVIILYILTRALDHSVT